MTVTLFNDGEILRGANWSRTATAFLMLRCTSSGSVDFFFSNLSTLAWARLFPGNSCNKRLELQFFYWLKALVSVRSSLLIELRHHLRLPFVLINYSFPLYNNINGQSRLAICSTTGHSYGLCSMRCFLRASIVEWMGSTSICVCPGSRKFCSIVSNGRHLVKLTLKSHAPHNYR